MSGRWQSLVDLLRRSHSPALPPLITPLVEPPSDIEPLVAQYALRSFAIDGVRLKSLCRRHWWDGGVAVAMCVHCSSPPGEDCKCGLYGTLTLDQLMEEYGSWASQCVAVIAVEGKTQIGNKGLRTAAARIVAYWASSDPAVAYWRHPRALPDDIAKAFAVQCPEARVFADRAEMLRAYKFPAWEPPPLPSALMDDPPALTADPLWAVGSPVRSSAWVTSRIDSSTGLFQQATTPWGDGWCTRVTTPTPPPMITPRQWDLYYAPLMTGASPQGIAALKHLLGVT